MSLNMNAFFHKELSEIYLFPYQVIVGTCVLKEYCMQNY